MKSLLLSALLFGTTALADGPFDGTWVSTAESATLDKKPWVITLNKGMWTSDLNVPPVKVKADGTDQPSPGHPAFDAVAVKVVSPETVEVTNKKDGKTIFARTLVVPADGRSMVSKWSDTSGATPATGETVYQRVKTGPKNSHAVSGAWKTVKIQNLSSSATTSTYKSTADGMTLSLPTGQSYDAKWDGKDAPFLGDSSPGTVALKRHGASSFTETYKQGGKVVEIDTITVSSDGKSMTVKWESPRTHRHGAYVATKQ